MNKKLLALTVGLVMMLGTSACSSSSAKTTESTTISNISENMTSTSESKIKLSGTVAVNGSTTIQPLADSITALLNKTQPNLAIEVQGTGSSAGIKGVTNGTADIGMSSRELKAEEKAQGIEEHLVAYDGIAIITNPANKVLGLTSAQIKDIFEGTITNWKEVGGNDADIIVVSREAGSGTRSAFEEILKLTKKDGEAEVSSLKAEALIAEGNGAIKASLASKENAISYMSEGYIDESVKALKVDDVECTVDNIKSNTYKISRPLLLVTNGEISKESQAFIDCFLSDEGQKIVAEKYITVK